MSILPRKKSVLFISRIRDLNQAERCNRLFQKGMLLLKKTSLQDAQFSKKHLNLCKTSNLQLIPNHINLSSLLNPKTTQILTKTPLKSPPDYVALNPLTLSHPLHPPLSPSSPTPATTAS